MYTQKESIKKAVQSFDYRSARYKFICEWLEDINWHHECALVSQKFTEEDEEKEFNIVKATRSENQYNYEMKRAGDLVCGFNQVFGWGLDNSWTSGGQGQAFVDELLELFK